MSTESVPLKIHVDVRDIWDSSTSTIKQSSSSLTKVLGHQITAEAEWPALWNELKDHFPDKSGFVLTVSKYTVAWYEVLLARVEDDAHEEWTERFLEMLNAKNGGVVLKVEPCPGNTKTRPITKWNKNTGQFFLGIPKSDLISQARITTFLEKDLDNLFEDSPASTGSPDDGDAEWAHVSGNGNVNDKSAREIPQVKVEVNGVVKPNEVLEPLTRRLPALELLARPNELFKSTAPHILMVNHRGDKMTIQCSHEPSLELLANYLKKWGKTNPNDSLRRPVYKIDLVESDFSFGLIDSLTIEPHTNYPKGINPTLILSFIEGVLGYTMVETSGGYWMYRSTSLLK
ncbi:hypothetical protein K435DRAFT_968602 [Dendrothele bispora CBS 962.96]|uniref:Uncharacterized protein n=1 Tax=Dendrothele bispora (strain CBS 962.96) TaxID=1314807 RepID=A0A4S8LN86_DENBC|nr:hypothetical protein K435DRAFT_968602 [Dendrothele bispora CBS 962.96]